MSGLDYVQPHELCEMLSTPEKQSRVLVLDVRDDDWCGGNIKGSLNIPSEVFDEELDGIVDKLVVGKEVVVVHCMFSQERGPRCAGRLAQRLKARGILSLRVLVLRGGFKGWLSQYRHDSDMVENM